MKKVFQIALVFTWLLSISGVVVSKHYCGPFLKNIALGHSSRHCCMDAADEPNDCCKNTLEYQSVEDDFLKVEKLATSSPVLFVLYSVEIPSFLQSTIQHTPFAFGFAEDTGPPSPSNPPYISYGSLLI